MRRQDQHRPVQLNDWPDAPSGRRVLVECSDLAVGWAIERVLARDGYEVALCEGPDKRLGTRCQLVDDGHCPLVEDADVIVNELGLTAAEARRVLAAVSEARPELPVVVEVTPSEEAACPELLARCRVLAFPASGREVAEAVGSALPDEVTTRLRGHARLE